MKEYPVQRVAMRDENGVVRTVRMGGGGGGGKRTFRGVIVGTSAAGWTDADCDFLCNGYVDRDTWDAIFSEVSINGGQILFLDGKYEFQSEISISNSETHITLAGCGDMTILEIPSNSASIFIVSSKNITICDMTIKEIPSNNSNTSAITAWDISDLTIRGVRIDGYTGSAIEVSCWISEQNAKNIIVEGCKINTQKTAISLAGVEDCLIQGNIITISAETYGVIKHDSYYGTKYRPGKNVIISGNIISALSLLKNEYSAAISPSENCIVQNNTMKNFSHLLRAGSIFDNFLMCGNILTDAISEYPENINIGENAIVRDNIVRLRAEE